MGQRKKGHYNAGLTKSLYPGKESWSKLRPHWAEMARPLHPHLDQSLHVGCPKKGMASVR